MVTTTPEYANADHTYRKKVYPQSVMATVGLGDAPLPGEVDFALTACLPGGSS